MKITIYELLGLIKDGKQPSHIRVYGIDWYWNNYDGYVTEESLTTTPDAQCYLFSQYRLDFTLDKKVEIIEEKEIEEINVWYEFDGKNNDEIIYHMCTELKDKINELVKAVNSLKDDK